MNSSRDGAGTRREIISLYRARSGGVCWSAHDWIPVRRAQEYEMENLEKMVWFVFRFFSSLSSFSFLFLLLGRLGDGR